MVWKCTSESLMFNRSSSLFMTNFVSFVSFIKEYKGTLFCLDSKIKFIFSIHKKMI